MKHFDALLLLLCFCFGLTGCGDKQADSIEIFPTSISVVPGVGLGLSVRGYTEDGRPVEQKQIDELELVWEYRSEDNAFTVDENGYLKAIKEGIGNVWVRTTDGRLDARPITVQVKEIG